MTRPRLVVAGIGPAGPEFITAAVSAAIARVPTRFIRTTRHPSAIAVGRATSFDDLYEASDTFDQVYSTIRDLLVSAADEHGEILYAVPGSPLVLERTVRLLLDDDRVECDLLPAISFLDLAYAALRIDPVEAGVRLIDGHTFATSAAGLTGPLLVAHCHANWVLSDIKLAVDDASGDEEVVILQRLGGPDQHMVTTTWAELDRTVDADHLTSIYVPRLTSPVGHELIRFHGIVRRLREECPWDREQTHQSLARYALEETYELVEAIGALDSATIGSNAVDLGSSDSPDSDAPGSDASDPEADEHLAEELGDVLLQVVLHSAIAEQEGRFNLADVARAISAKMIRRHPHVFGDVSVDGADEVATNWAAIKAAERVDRSAPSPLGGTFDGVGGSLPSLMFARELQSAAAKLGFDWDEPRLTLDKVAEELAEVAEAWDDPIHVTEELGDLLFAVVNAARHIRVEPEIALRQASAKFRRRVEALLALATERSIDTRTCGLLVLDQLWDDVKSTERVRFRR